MHLKYGGFIQLSASDVINGEVDVMGFKLILVFGLNSLSDLSHTL